MGGDCAAKGRGLCGEGEGTVQRDCAVKGRGPCGEEFVHGLRAGPKFLSY